MVNFQTFESVSKQSYPFPYLTYLPEDYDPAKQYPLVVFLHGAGERGNERASLARHGWFKHAEQGEQFPFIMVAPQCPEGKYWGSYIESLNVFLDTILETYSVDRNRVYLTGLSMGGTGTWLWSLSNPERFAAVAPICGTGVYWFAERLVDKPLWVFHGDKDDIVPLLESEHMVESLRKRGGNPKFTVLPGVGHNAWNYAYNQELADWFLQYSL